MIEHLQWLDRQSQVMTILLQYGPLGVTELKDLAGMGTSNVCNVLKELHEAGCIQISGRWRARRYDIKGRGS